MKVGKWATLGAAKTWLDHISFCLAWTTRQPKYIWCCCSNKGPAKIHIIVQPLYCILYLSQRNNYDDICIFSKVWTALFSSWQPDNQNSYKSFRRRLTTVNVEHVFDINWTSRQPRPIPSKVYHCLYILRTTRLPNLFSLKFWESWVFFLWTTRQPDSYNILKSLRWKMTAGTTY